MSKQYKPKLRHYNNNPYCRTCHKAGKTYEQYTNHWTRSEPGPNGIITCPLIINTTCSRCKLTGHWAKYCTAIITTPYTEHINPRSWSNVLRTPPPTIPPIVLNDDSGYIRPPSPDYPPPPHSP